MGSTSPETDPPVRSGLSPSQNTLTTNNTSRSHLQSTLSYIWTTNDSMFSGDVDRWIAGDMGSPTHANNYMPPHSFRVTGSAPQRAALSHPALPSSRFWYVAAMLLPLINLNGCRNWRCSPSSFLNTVELLLAQVAGYCGQAHSNLRRMADDQSARDLFAGAMNVILVVYALGFLFLSLYQASVFHQF